MLPDAPINHALATVGAPLPGLQSLVAAETAGRGPGSRRVAADAPRTCASTTRGTVPLETGRGPQP